MSVVLNDWLWSRGDVNGYTTVASSIRYKNGMEVNLVFIAKDDEVFVASGGHGVRVLEGAKEPNFKTGKPTSTDCIYFFETPEGKDSVIFKGENTIALFPFGEDQQNIWWYTRYNASTSIDMNINYKDYSVEGNSTFEAMDFLGEPKQVLSRHQPKEGNNMIDGTYNVMLKTPMGVRKG